MDISEALRDLAKRVSEAGDDNLPILLNGAAHEIERLKAQVEQLQKMMTVFHNLEDKITELRAQVGRAGFVECYFALRRAEYGDTFDLIKYTDEYDNQLRAAAKAGE